jgi:hypothetical protein
VAGRLVRPAVDEFEELLHPIGLLQGLGVDPRRLVGGEWTAALLRDRTRVQVEQEPTLRGCAAGESQVPLQGLLVILVRRVPRRVRNELDDGPATDTADRGPARAGGDHEVRACTHQIVHGGIGGPGLPEDDEESLRVPGARRRDPRDRSIRQRDGPWGRAAAGQPCQSGRQEGFRA